ncbi:hypothetical protein QR680_006167 [Steinernema hermaphroditum]|uniref:Uncharacterized protein n=1 Tax=Steinernema hermaphroditum TaxID=289476 RepID=A0AA39HVX5_9BILA|nr:hypothetical protein QR680_006167 [Steinernema hermaphroditum]
MSFGPSPRMKRVSYDELESRPVDVDTENRRESDESFPFWSTQNSGDDPTAAMMIPRARPGRRMSMYERSQGSPKNSIMMLLDIRRFLLLGEREVDEQSDFKHITTKNSGFPFVLVMNVRSIQE